VSDEHPKAWTAETALGDRFAIIVSDLVELGSFRAYLELHSVNLFDGAHWSTQADVPGIPRDQSVTVADYQEAGRAYVEMVIRERSRGAIAAVPFYRDEPAQVASLVQQMALREQPREGLQEIKRSTQSRDLLEVLSKALRSGPITVSIVKAR
jgi:hypothetical protein